MSNVTSRPSPVRDSSHPRVRRPREGPAATSPPATTTLRPGSVARSVPHRDHGRGFSSPPGSQARSASCGTCRRLCREPPHAALVDLDEVAGPSSVEVGDLDACGAGEVTQERYVILRPAERPFAVPEELVDGVDRDHDGVVDPSPLTPGPALDRLQRGPPIFPTRILRQKARPLPCGAGARRCPTGCRRRAVRRLRSANRVVAVLEIRSGYAVPATRFRPPDPGGRREPVPPSRCPYRRPAPRARLRRCPGAAPRRCFCPLPGTNAPRPNAPLWCSR